MTQVKIRAVGRDQFWSAGRRWTAEGRVVTIVEGEKLPRKFLRARVDERYGNYVLNEDEIGEGDPIPLVPARSTKAFWKGAKMFVRHDTGRRTDKGEQVFQDYEVLTELDLPARDGDFQTWSLERRAHHDRSDEITQEDYAQVRADYRFLAIENPEPPAYEPPTVKGEQPKQNQQQQRR